MGAVTPQPSPALPAFDFTPENTKQLQALTEQQKAAFRRRWWFTETSELQFMLYNLSEFCLTQRLYWILSNMLADERGRCFLKTYFHGVGKSSRSYSYS